ncbi:hypothetical protein PQR67_13915 [Paraburkholderia fungorum]|uniref:hypothetical protein n=1 Tax=Paraburkholderia fungorum TaxID=134537 RepID=UPI0038BA831A
MQKKAKARVCSAQHAHWQISIAVHTNAADQLSISLASHAIPKKPIPNLGAPAIRSIVATDIADVLEDIRASAFTYGTSASVMLASRTGVNCLVGADLLTPRDPRVGQLIAASQCRLTASAPDLREKANG